MILIQYAKIFRYGSWVVALLSAISALLIVLAPNDVGLKNIDPTILKVVIVCLLLIFGTFLPTVAGFISRDSLLLVQAIIIAIAAFANGVAMSPHVAVAVQSLTSTLAILASIALAVLCVTAFWNKKERSTPTSKF